MPYKDKKKQAEYQKNWWKSRRDDFLEIRYVKNVAPLRT
jgi:hypothetical protein